MIIKLGSECKEWCDEMTDLEIRQMTDFQGGDDDAVVCLGGFVMPDLRLG